MRLDEAAAVAGLTAGSRRPLGVAQGDAVAAGELLDRLAEGEVVDLAQEADDVAALAAPEAVPGALGGADVERRAALVVEGAQALEAAAARGLERDVVADDLVDPGPLAHEDDVLVPDPASHALILRTAVQPPARSRPSPRP